MTAKIIRFPLEKIGPRRNVLIPRLLYYRADDPEQTIIDALSLYSRGVITSAQLEKVQAQILDRLTGTNVKQVPRHPYRY